jgi:NHL repeat
MRAHLRKVDMTKISALTRGATLAVCAGMLAGCGGGVLQSTPAAVQPAAVRAAAAPTDCTPAWLPNPRAIVCHRNTEKSWMSTAAAAKPLLYVSDIGAEDVDVLSYPGGKQVGTLTGFNEPAGICTDRKGDVFIADGGNNSIVEYTHGGTTPIATLQGGSPGTPLGCSVDPKSGNLAVTNFTANPGQFGSVMIYTKASGAPQQSNALYHTYYCAYDDGGNLYVDGFDNSGRVALVEFAQGQSPLTHIALDMNSGWAGGLAWNGKHLLMEDPIADKFVPSRPRNAIYVLTIASGIATLEQTMPLGGGVDVSEFAVRGKTAIAADASNEDVGYYPFPQGGNPTKTFTEFYEPLGVAISN